MKILVVDDEFVSLQKLSLLLKDRGQVDAATSGEQALEMFIKAEQDGAPYQLITLDYDMPGISGPETAEKIRNYEEENGISSLHASVKILMVTAMSDGKSIMSSFKGGCEGYLKKPFNKDEIKSSLEKIGL
jgi:two-component system chemotaxis response regulator CheY